MIYVLLLPYALLRWGSGREVMIGLSIIVVAGVLGIASDYTGFGEAAAGFVFLMFPAVLGALVRFWTTSRTREIDQVQAARARAARAGAARHGGAPRLGDGHPRAGGTGGRRRPTRPRRSMRSR